MRFFLNLLVGLAIVLASISMAPSLRDASIPVPVQTASGEIIINELMYDPYWDEATEEWVELHNPGTLDVNVANWTLSDQDGTGADFVFPDMDFPAGGYALVHNGLGTNSASFADGKADFYMQKTSGIWPPAGDDVLLCNSTGATVDFLSYGAWDANEVDDPPADFLPYEHSNASAEEGFSIALTGGTWKQSVPSPLCFNGEDLRPPVLITEVHYYAYIENEYARIYNPLATEVDISGWYLSDGEGMMAFPDGTSLASGGSIAVSQNPVNYILQSREVPDFEYGELNASIPDMVLLNYVPVMANEGDELFLFNRFGSPVDAFIYGSSTYSGPGWSLQPAAALKLGQVARRAFTTQYADTNTSADWDCLRPYYIGQSDFAVESFDSAGQMTVFSSPDSSFDVVTGAVDSAAQSFWLSVYEFTSPELVWHLVSAAQRGVDVRVFLEGAPVGGITDVELYLARKVVEAGGSVRMMISDPGNDIYDRYSYVHSKYAIIDGGTLLVTSENWSPTGIPATGTTGNRGWGALIGDAALAGYFTTVFEDDWNPSMRDSAAFDPSHELWDSGVNATSDADECRALFEPAAITSGARFTPVFSPDTSLSQDTILGMLASATERVYVEEFYIYKHWGSRSEGSVEETPNLYLEAVIDAARRGCEVRILMDASYYNTDSDDPIDNDDTAVYVNTVAAAEGLDMEAKCVNLDQHGFGKIHNKGLIADESVLISSINWNLNSVVANRESGVIIENAEAAEYFAGIFDYDWTDDTTAPFAHFFAEAGYKVNTTVRLNASSSSDNVGIVNYTWNLDGARTFYGIDFEWFFHEVGQHALNLTVADAWGNSGSFGRTFNITLTAPEPGDDDDGNTTDDGTGDVPGDDDDGDANETASDGDDTFDKMFLILLLLPILFFIAILAVVLIRRRR